MTPRTSALAIAGFGLVLGSCEKPCGGVRVGDAIDSIKGAEPGCPVKDVFCGSGELVETNVYGGDSKQTTCCLPSMREEFADSARCVCPAGGDACSTKCEAYAGAQHFRLPRSHQPHCELPTVKGCGAYVVDGKVVAVYGVCVEY